MFSVFVEVFKNTKYIALALCVSFAVFTFAVWLPNLGLIMLVTFDSVGSLMEKVSFVLSLYGSIGTNFTLTSAIYTTAIALMFGINISLLVYYIKRMRRGISGLGNTGALGISGFVSGLLGIGCAACGTFILTTVLGLVGAGGLLTFLPLGGEEFGFLGVGLLVYSIYILTKKIKAPLVCPV